MSQHPQLSSGRSSSQGVYKDRRGDVSLAPTNPTPKDSSLLTRDLAPVEAAGVPLHSTRGSIGMVLTRLAVNPFNGLLVV